MLVRGYFFQIRAEAPPHPTVFFCFFLRLCLTFVEVLRACVSLACRAPFLAATARRKSAPIFEEKQKKNDGFFGRSPAIIHTRQCIHQTTTTTRSRCVQHEQETKSPQGNNPGSNKQENVKALLLYVCPPLINFPDTV